MTEIAKILRREVRERGVIPFARFMELALYCPHYGYYEQPKGVIGRGGDYYTNVNVGPLFGDLLAFQFAEWLGQMPVRPSQVVEAGAHDGQLATTILGWLATKYPELFESLEYWIVEPSVTRQGWQKGRLEKFAGRVRWFDSLCALSEAGVKGIIFSNELLDAMPVHRLGWNAIKARWFEWGVAIRQDEFVWERMPQESKDWVLDLADAGWELPDELTAALPDGFTIEISLAAAEWWRRAASALRQGHLLAIDYGFSAAELFTPERRQGTLRAYHRHHVSAEVLARAGEQDLTAHVNFTQLQRAGEAAELKTEGLFSQAQFLTGIAQKTWQKDAPFGDWSSARVRQFQTLTHPEHLGRLFRVLLQSR